MKAINCIECSVAMRTKPINTHEVNFLLFTCCIETFNFVISSNSLKKGREHNLNATGVVLLGCESTCLSIEIPTRMRTGWHGLPHRVAYIWLASIPTLDLDMFAAFSDESFINEGFVFKKDRWTTTNIISIFLEICFHELLEVCVCRFVLTNVGQVWYWTTKLQLVDIFVVVKGNDLLHCFQSRNNSFLLYRAEKVFE